MDPRGERTGRAVLNGEAGDVSLAHRRLVEWVAEASVGDPFPEPWSYASDPITSIVRTLISIDVIERPAPGTDVATVARDAAVAARAWLEAHPPRSGPHATAR